MNKKAIGFIIGLMVAALAGLAILQVYWISWSIQLNEDQFDNNIYASLSRITDRIERDEVDQALSILSNLADQSSFIIKKNEDPDGPNSGFSVEASYEKYLGTDTTTYLGKEFLKMYSSTHCNDPNCKTCKYKRKKTLIDFIALKNEIIPRPLTERINLKSLDIIIKQELTKSGIDAKYHYGIFDDELQTLIIKDNRFLNTTDTKVAKAGFVDPILSSKFRVGLFTDSKITGQPPGLLFVFFPGKSGLIWSSVWKTLIASILYLGIILYCFFYIVRTIFQQKKVSEMKNDFINNMTHEFKTPIATISLAADSITSPTILANPDKIRRFADIIRQENKRMNSQVEKVLQMALLDRNEFKLKLSPINAHDVILSAVQNFSLQVESKGGQIITDLRALNPFIEADITHVTSMIHNLLDNANKYSNDHPKITVITRNVPLGVEITVKDNGIGIDKEAKKMIFDKFFRVHTGNLHDVKGFGLGLTYVRTMILAHKGTIDLVSELGKGSSFILTFPFKVQ
jgi:two-component system phosphate regulon sensor histidine kinase PhoR